MLAWPPSCSPGLWGNCWQPLSLLPLSVSVLCESKDTQWKQLRSKPYNDWISGLYHFLPLQPFFGLLPLGHLCPAVVVVFLSGWADVLRPIVARFVGLRWTEQENQAKQSEISSACLRVFKYDARPCNKTWNGPDIMGGLTARLWLRYSQSSRFSRYETRNGSNLNVVNIHLYQSLNQSETRNITSSLTAQLQRFLCNSE